MSLTRIKYQVTVIDFRAEQTDTTLVARAFGWVGNFQDPDVAARNSAQHSIFNVAAH